MTSGFQRGDLILIAARPSQGKTPVGVGLFSMEMSESAIASRLVASGARINLHDVRRGYLPANRWSALTNAAARIAEGPLHVDDSSYLTVLEVRRRVRILARDLAKTAAPLGLVIVDYIQIMQGGSNRPENRQQEVSEISRGLKSLAKDLNVPVVALSQLSRRVEDSARGDGRPRLSDMRDSGALEQDADLVMMIYHPALAKPNDPPVDPHSAEIIIAKQRQGPVGDVPLRFSRAIARFENPDSAGEGDGEAVQTSFD